MPNQSANEQKAINIIQEGNGLVKTICSPLDDNRSWYEILPKIAETKEMDSRHTEITATTLLPTDGKIKLFEPANPKYKVTVGLLFDLEKCKLQYIFQKNIFSKEWLNKKGAKIPDQISLNQLRAINSRARSQGIILENNEVLAGVSNNALSAVFSTKNDLFSRLNALSKQCLIKQELNKSLPILIITPEEGVVVYDEKKQQRDVLLALKRDEKDPSRILVERHIDVETKRTLLVLHPETSIFPKSFDKTSVFKMIASESHDFSSIEDAIRNLHDSDPMGAGEVFHKYLENRRNINIIELFLKHCPNMKIEENKKNVVFIMNDNWDASGDIVVDIKKWSPLVEAVLCNSASISELIVNGYPNKIAHIMGVLNELHKISTCYKGHCEYSPEKVTAAQKTLLLQLKQKHAKYYTLTYADKRLVESHLNNEIKNIGNVKSLHYFYHQHVDGLYLNQHRHANYDVFTRRLFPRIKENTLMALKTKVSQLANNDISVSTSENVSHEIKKLKDILSLKKEALLKQHVRKSFFTFYSVSRTDIKITAISAALLALDKISDFPEFKFFVEGLLVNDDLIARRSVGVAASDTYLKLKSFYDDCFVSHQAIESLVN